MWIGWREWAESEDWCLAERVNIKIQVADWSERDLLDLVEQRVLLFWEI